MAGFNYLMNFKSILKFCVSRLIFHLLSQPCAKLPRDAREAGEYCYALFIVYIVA